MSMLGQLSSRSLLTFERMPYIVGANVRLCKFRIGTIVLGTIIWSVLSQNKLNLKNYFKVFIPTFDSIIKTASIKYIKAKHKYCEMMSLHNQHLEYVTHIIQCLVTYLQYFFINCSSPY